MELQKIIMKRDRYESKRISKSAAETGYLEIWTQIFRFTDKEEAEIASIIPKVTEDGRPLLKIVGKDTKE